MSPPISNYIICLILYRNDLHYGYKATVSVEEKQSNSTETFQKQVSERCLWFFVCFCLFCFFHSECFSCEYSVALTQMNKSFLLLQIYMACTLTFSLAWAFCLHPCSIKSTGYLCMEVQQTNVALIRVLVWYYTVNKTQYIQVPVHILTRCLLF